MIKTTVALPSGAMVTIEGTDNEVVGIVARLEGLSGGGGREGRVHPTRSKKAKPTLPGLIAEMIGGGFFKEPKQLAAVKIALEQDGQFYPLTTLSPAMLRLVKTRQLRRLKDGEGRWSYVG